MFALVVAVYYVQLIDSWNVKDGYSEISLNVKLK
jgi:hypothetical protein